MTRYSGDVREQREITPEPGNGSGGMPLMPLNPFSRATPICHSGPAVCDMNRSNTKVTDNVTMPRNTPLIRPKNRKYPRTAAHTAAEQASGDRQRQGQPMAGAEVKAMTP